MTQTNVPGFEIVGPMRMGLLNQFATMGWKWYSPFGLYGEAVQMSSDDPAIVNHLVGKFIRFGAKWHRRTAVSANHHLWITAWRLRGRALSAERDLADTKDDRDAHWIDAWAYPSWFHRTLLRVFFGRDIPKKPVYEWEDDG